MIQPPLSPITPLSPNLPKPVILDNGTKLNVIPLKDAEIVRMYITFKGGRWVEKQVLQSTLATDQISAGTQFVSAEKLSETLDYYGASLNSSSGTQSSVITLTCLRRTLPQVLPLLKDIICSPAYEQQLIDIEKEELVFACGANKQNVVYVSKKTLQNAILGPNHPLAKVYDENDVLSIKRDDILDYHKCFINLDNANIYVSGAIDEDVISLVNQYLGSRGETKHESTNLPHISTATSTQQRHDAFIETESAQSALCMGMMLPSRQNPDYPAIALTRTILGGFFGSRLMKNIRERKGLTYGISADMLHIPYSSIFLVSTTTPYVHVDQCVDEVFNEIINLQNNKVDNEELTIAKNYLLGQYCRTTEMTLSLAALCIALEETGSNLDLHAQTIKQIQELSADDIMACAQKYLQVDKLIVAAAHGKLKQ